MCFFVSPGINWGLLIAMAFQWVLVWVCMCKGIKSLAYGAYALAPFVFTMVFLNTIKYGLQHRCGLGIVMRLVRRLAP